MVHAADIRAQQAHDCRRQARHHRISQHQYATASRSRDLVAEQKYADDRSLVGERDSEIAALISDTAEVRSTMDGRNFTAAKFAITMRRELWTLLLAAHAPEDPVSRQSLDMWRHTANVVR